MNEGMIMVKKLNPLEVFNAVYQLFEIYHEETGSDSIITMLSDMGFDIGMWDIWMKSVDIILDEEGVENHESLTSLQGFKVLPLYLEGFYTLSIFDDIRLLVEDIQLTIKNKSTDSKIWQQWQKCFNYILTEEDINYRYHENPLFNLSNLAIRYPKNIDYFFNSRKGHWLNFLENKALIEGVIKDQANYCGVDDYGNALYIKELSSDMRIWVYVRHITKIVNCGFAATEKEYDTLTLFSKEFGIFKKRGFSYEYKIFEPKIIKFINNCMKDMNDAKLTSLQAFNAVFKLFEIYYNEKGSGSIRTSLGMRGFDQQSGNISIMLGTMNLDEGMWEIWIESINAILNEEVVKNHDHFTPLQVFKAIPLYLEGFYGTDFFDDIISLVLDLRLIIKDRSTDSILWKQWMQCVNDILSVEDSRYYPKSLS